MRLPRTRYEIVVQVLCLLMLAGTLITLALCWAGLPDQIPAHYNALGQIDRWGSKNEALLLPLLAAGIFVLLSVVERFPRLWNTGVQVTAENQWRIYAILRNLLLTTKLLLVALLGLLSVMQLRQGALPVWLMPVFLVALACALGFFLGRLYRAR